MIDGFLVEIPLIPLEREEVVALFGDDLFGKLPLRSHGSDGDGVTLQVELIEDSSDGSDLILLLGNVVLAKREALGCSPGTDDVNGALLEGVAAAQALSVDIDDLIAQGCVDGAKVLAKAVVEMIRINEGEDVCEGLRGWNAIGCCDPFLKPFKLKLAEIFDLSEVVHSAKSCSDGHEEDFAEMIFFMMASARIFEDLERIKTGRKATAIVDLMWISRHSDRLPLLYMVYGSRGAQFIAHSLA